MVIRYMNVEGVYFSLNDVADFLREEEILTARQNQLFRHQCQAHISRELAKAYKRKQHCGHLQPIILPTSDYFIHCAVWDVLFTLLSPTASQQRKIDYLTFMLSEPDSIHRYPAMFVPVDLICLTRRTSRSVKSLPGPLVLEERDN